MPKHRKKHRRHSKPGQHTPEKQPSTTLEKPENIIQTPAPPAQEKSSSPNLEPIKTPAKEPSIASALKDLGVAILCWPVVPIVSATALCALIASPFLDTIASMIKPHEHTQPHPPKSHLPYKRKRDKYGNPILLTPVISPCSDWCNEFIGTYLGEQNTQDNEAPDAEANIIMLVALIALHVIPVIPAQMATSSLKALMQASRMAKEKSTYSTDQKASEPLAQQTKKRGQAHTHLTPYDHPPLRHYPKTPPPAATQLHTVLGANYY